MSAPERCQGNRRVACGESAHSCRRRPHALTPWSRCALREHRSRPC